MVPLAPVQQQQWPTTDNPDRVRATQLLPWLTAICAIGVLARMVRYLGGWPFWGDEAGLAISFGRLDFLQLLQPLPFMQVAPPGYLWAVKTSVLLGGFGEYSLRFVAIVSSLLALWLVYRLCRTLFLGWAWFLPIALFAVSHYQIRHAAEVKQYALDTLASVLLVVLGILAARGRWRPAILLLGATPLALFCSYPAVFTAGGIGLSLIPRVWQYGNRRGWIWLVGYLVLVAGTWAALYVWLLRPQLAVHGQGMTTHWKEAFIDTSSPARLLGWLLQTMTGVTFAIPVGGKNGASLVSALLFCIGIPRLWRLGNQAFAGILAGTVGLALIAALVGKYPFGGHARVMQYLAPLLCVPMGLGIATLMDQLPWLTSRRDFWVRFVLAGLLFLGLANVLRDVARPYHGLSCRDQREFARWFWREYRLAGELHCVSTAWNAKSPGSQGCAWHYPFYRQLYAAEVPVETSWVPRVTSRVGLVVNTTRQAGGRVALERWRRELQAHYLIADHDHFTVNGGESVIEEYHVLWVEPRDK